jgi:hypothetical protein
VNERGVTEVVMYDMRRQSGWSFFNALTENPLSSVKKVILENFDISECWSGSQCSKVVGKSNIFHL